METNELSSSSTQRYHFLTFSENENLAVFPLEKKRDRKKKAF